MENPNNNQSNIAYPDTQQTVQMAPAPKQPKSRMLFVISIIMLVFAAISLISSVISALGLGAIMETYKSMGMDSEMADKVRSLLQASIIFSLIFTISKIIFGIIGILSAKKPERANLIVIFGCIMVGFVFISLVISKPLTDTMRPFLASLGAGNTADFGNIIGVILSLIFPVLYIIAGIMLGRLKEDDSTV